MSKLSAKAYLQQTHQCHYCNGTGKVHPNNIEDDCGMCDGRGHDWPESGPNYARMEAYHAAAMAEPFDPAKHLSGWVKDRNFPNRYSHGAFKIIDLGNQSKWAIQDEWGDVYQGPIKTAAFFHALCEALNIKA